MHNAPMAGGPLAYGGESMDLNMPYAYYSGPPHPAAGVYNVNVVFVYPNCFNFVSFQNRKRIPLIA